jgi:hypothetical protein
LLDEEHFLEVLIGRERCDIPKRGRAIDLQEFLADALGFGVAQDAVDRGLRPQIEIEAVLCRLLRLPRVPPLVFVGAEVERDAESPALNLVALPGCGLDGGVERVLDLLLL